MSVNVGFEQFGPGTCIWCKREKDEVFTVVFSDKSFVGPMCKPDLLRAIRSKCEEPAVAQIKPQGNGASVAVAVK
jgi:hypothetical protein